MDDLEFYKSVAMSQRSKIDHLKDLLSQCTQVIEDVEYNLPVLSERVDKLLSEIRLALINN